MGFFDRIINKAVEKAIKEKGLNPMGTNALPISLGTLSLEYDQKDYISANSSKKFNPWANDTNAALHNLNCSNKP